MLKISWKPILFAMFLPLLACGETAETPTPSTTSEPTEVTSSSSTNSNKEITGEMYQAITNEMTYEEVVNITGIDGDQMSETAIEGAPTTTVYTWANNNGSNMTLTFQDNTLFSKAQFGLIENNASVTKAQYDQVETGMTYQQVTEILGSSGEELSRTELEGFPTTVIYVWNNKDFSNMNVTFQDEKVISKAQSNLK